MAFTNYHTVKGRVLAESLGTDRKGYFMDALGSVTGLIDAAGSLVAQFLYEAYGASRQVYGSPVTPQFGWCGSWGYRTLSLANALNVRARSYDARLSLWTTRDQLWPGERPYDYVHQLPTISVDITGMLVSSGKGKGGGGGQTSGGASCPTMQSCCKKLNLDTKQTQIFLLCMKSKGYSDQISNEILSRWRQDCGSSGPAIHITCATGPVLGDAQCPNRCGEPNNLGSTVCTTIPNPLDPKGTKCDPIPPSKFGCPQLCSGSNECVIVVCAWKLNTDFKACITLFHELLHCHGLSHKGPKGPYVDVIYDAAQGCLTDALNGGLP